jgi:DnaJ-class molecular chaperone
MQDYYSTLGVGENATDDDIKSAFRKLAMKYHPDKNPGDSSAEDNFKKINEAHSVLSDRQKRAEYDNAKRYGGSEQFNNGGAQHFHFNFDHMGGIDDVIQQFFAQNGFGHPFAQQARRNRDLQLGVEITLEDAYQGKDLPIAFKANGQDVNVVVRIPPGIEHGTRMRFQGYGDKSMPSAPPGDLYVTINIYNHPIFRRDGPHLHCILNVDVLDAIVGTTIDVDCIDNTRVSVNVPAGIQHGTALRVKQKGMSIRQNPNQRGDLIVNINLTVPRDLTIDQMATLKTVIQNRRS